MNLRYLPTLARVLVVLTLALAQATTSLADVGPPAHLQISEGEPGELTVRWRVPTVLPPRAVPAPELPASCRPASPPSVTEQPGAWLFTQSWRCDGSLAGQIVGLRFPFPDLALTTVARVELATGDRFAQLLSPGDPPWRLPEGVAVPDALGLARDALVAGGAHVLEAISHMALLLAISLLGWLHRPLRLVALFALGQVVGVSAATVWGASIDLAVAELAVGLAAVLVARQLLNAPEDRRGVGSLLVAAGIVHGLAAPSLVAPATGESLQGLVPQLLAVLGMDAVHLIGVTLLLPLGALVMRSADHGTTVRRLAYAAGAVGAALVLGLSLTGGGSTGTAPGDSASVVAPITPEARGGQPASQRVAPGGLDVPLQSFISVEPFEIRHEVMVSLDGLVDELGLDPESAVDIAAQPALTARLSEMLLGITTATIDGEVVAPTLRRADFMTVDTTGALPRANPVPEPVSEARVGVVITYPVQGMAEAVELTWTSLPDVVEIVPTTLIDPESVRSVALSPAAPSATWSNELIDDPIPAISAIAVEAARFPIPLLSLPLLGLGFFTLARAARSKMRAPWVAACRLALALAVLAGPMLATSVAIPGSAGRAPDAAQARRLLAGLLPNVYRALEFREEGRIYDRLAVTVTGETLTDVYLQQRRSLELEERGGAQARVETVEVLAASEIEPGADGFSVRATWTVGGMVTHFGHRHFRQNRYDARLGIVAADGTWKIRTIDVLEQERLK